MQNLALSSLSLRLHSTGFHSEQPDTKRGRLVFSLPLRLLSHPAH